VPKKERRREIKDKKRKEGQEEKEILKGRRIDRKKKDKDRNKEEESAKERINE
jgi:hypothetical protein